jgi:8-oxo-dGTP diphosphatase
MTEDARQIIGVAAVVRDGDGRILLIKTAKAGWELPGGRVEQGEDFISALKREVGEEACCDIEVGRLTSVTTNVTRGVTELTFLGRHMAGDPQPADDSLDAGWFDPDTAVELVTHPTEHLRLTDAIGDSQGVVYRAYRHFPGDRQQHESYDMFCLHQEDRAKHG